MLLLLVKTEQQGHLLILPESNKPKEARPFSLPISVSQIINKNSDVLRSSSMGADWVNTVGSRDLPEVRKVRCPVLQVGQTTRAV